MKHSLRLGNLAKEFNVSPDHIITFLSDNGISINNNPNIKLTEEAYLLLQEEFKTDKLMRGLANEITNKLPPRPPVPFLNNKSYKKICFTCDSCNKTDNITIRDSEFILHSNEPMKVWLYELDFNCRECDGEIKFHLEVHEEPNASSNFTINLSGAKSIDCPKDSLDDEEDSYKSRRNDYDPYENFHWGGLSGEEAYVGYWNTD